MAAVNEGIRFPEEYGEHPEKYRAKRRREYDDRRTDHEGEEE